MLIYATNIGELIEKVSKYSHTSSQIWSSFTNGLKNYLTNGDLDLYRIKNIVPHIFTWPESSGQNITILNILEKNKDNIFYKTIIKTNNYGPHGIKLYNNIQLDRVQQAWSIYNLVNSLNLNLDNCHENILEFGGGTGQMADVLHDLGFKGKHIVYDLPLMIVLQRHFVDKRCVKTQHILDDEGITFINGTNYLPCNQERSEKMIMKLPNINFIATYSLSETDINTHNKFAEYIMNFSRIFIVYMPDKTHVGDYIDNHEYIEKIQSRLDATHFCYIGTDYGGGKTFMAVKKSLTNCKIIPPPLE
jgi:hypothetical protein